jgi:hypothetical protein
MTVNSSVAQVLKSAFNMHKLKFDKSCLKKILESKNYFISTAEHNDALKLIISQCIASKRSSIFILHSIQEMHEICDALTKIHITSIYMHSQLSDDEMVKRTELLNNAELKLLFITPERLLKGSVSSILSTGDIAQIVFCNAEKLAHDHIHVSSGYTKTVQTINILESELAKRADHSIWFKKIFIGHCLSRAQIQSMANELRLINFDCDIYPYRFNKPLIQSVELKNKSSLIKECIFFASRAIKSVIVCLNENDFKLLNNELSGKVNVFSYCETNKNTKTRPLLDTLTAFKNAEQGVLLSNKYGPLFSLEFEQALLCQLPLSPAHLLSIIQSNMHLKVCLKEIHLFSIQDISMNRALYDVNAKFPSGIDHKHVIDYLSKLSNAPFDKRALFTLAKELSMPVQSAFKIVENLIADMFIKKTTFFNKGFQEKYEILGLTRPVNTTYELTHLSAVSQLHNLQSILNSPECKLSSLNDSLGITEAVLCGKCPACNSAFVNPNHNKWADRVPYY